MKTQIRKWAKNINRQFIDKETQSGKKKKNSEEILRTQTHLIRPAGVGTMGNVSVGGCGAAGAPRPCSWWMLTGAVILRVSGGFLVVGKMASVFQSWV